MPPKIRELKAKLRKAGFSSRPGKGSHSVWTHTKLPGHRLVMSGSDSHDAQHYQETDVETIVEQLRDQLRKEQTK